MNKFDEITDIILVMLFVLAVLSLGGYLADIFHLNPIWLPQILLFSLAVTLQRTRLFDHSVKSLKGFCTGLIFAPFATAAAFTASLLSSTVIPPSPEYAEKIESLRPSNLTQFLTAIAFSLFLVAPAEEIIFRGIIHMKLRKIVGARKALVCSSTIFALSHFDVARILPTFVIGMFTAYSVNRTNSITPAIIIHGTNNTAYFVLSFLSSSTFATEELSLP
ncbi:MAG: type II CAAX endopeptidase family protein [Candidatus Caldarchaeum sp.]|nr:type II CAAX endopeptidase family protein [Candidatus Caldarchaeum sp.]